MPFNYNFGQRPVNRFAPNYDFRSGIQPNPNQLGRMSATFEQPVTNQPGYLPDQQPHDDQPPDFMSEYNKLMGSRPQRLAYQEAVNQGPEQIKRSKWAMLGAALASGGAALGGTRAPDAAGLGISAYMQPQERSDTKYKEKITRLGQSASMEQQDVEDQLKALEFKSGEYYKGQDLKLRQGEAVDRGKLTNAQIDNIHSEMDKRDSDEWIDPMSGIKWHRDKNGALSNLGKWGLTPAEEAAKEGGITKAKEVELEPGRKARDRADIEQARTVATIGATSRESVADKNAAARVAAVREHNKGIADKGFKPGDTAKQIWNDLTDEFATNPELAGEDFKDYVDVAEGPGGNSVINTKPEWSMGPVKIQDSIKTAAIKEAIRRAIARSIANSQGGKAGGGNVNTPGVNTAPPPKTPKIPEGFSIRTPSASPTPTPTPSVR